MEEAIKNLKKINAKRIFVQIPEGLKLKAQEISKKLEENGFEALICLEPTYGACDIRDEEAKRLGCDAILHFAHSNFGIKSKIPVIYYDYFIEADPIKILEKNYEKISKFEKICLVASLQFINAAKKVKKFLEKKGKKVISIKTEKYEMQILGCRLDAFKKIDADCFLCVSGGKFHALGLALQTQKPVFNLNLEKFEIHDLNELKTKIEKIVEWNKQAIKDANKIGFLISWKKGQIFGNPFEMKKRFEEKGKEVYLLAMDEISQEKIEGLKLDCLINFSCPRIAIDDLEKFKIPIINWSELEEF